MAMLAMVLGILIVAAVTPIRERVETWSRRFVRGHGLVVTVRRNPEGIPAGAGFFSLDPGFCELESPAWPSHFADWAYANGAADLGCTEVLVTLQATADTTLVVGRPLLKRESSETAPGCSWNYYPGRGGGLIEPRILRIHLPSERDGSVLGYLVEGEEASRRFSLKMSKGDVEQVKVTAAADDALIHRWRLELPVMVNGRERSVSVDDSGAVFTTIGSQAPTSTSRTFPGGI